MKHSELKQIIREEIQKVLNELSLEYPDEVKLTPQDLDHPVEYFILRKRGKNKWTKTPRYITVYPKGLDDYYDVDKIDFENKTLDAY